ncbi:MAG: hypothetical protein EOM24_33635 [Chloroflexia bacterium]|nr:hypothetical protein [Chloroflexia bacterium]
MHTTDLPDGLMGCNRPLPLQGLDPQRRYTIEGQPEVRSGAAWMHLGLDLSLGDFESCVVGFLP